MEITVDDMKFHIQEWFAQAVDFDDLSTIYYETRKEIDNQFKFMAHEINNKE